MLQSHGDLGQGQVVCCSGQRCHILMFYVQYNSNQAIMYLKQDLASGMKLKEYSTLKSDHIRCCWCVVMNSLVYFPHNLLHLLLLKLVIFDCALQRIIFYKPQRTCGAENIWTWQCHVVPVWPVNPLENNMLPSNKRDGYSYVSNSRFVCLRVDFPLESKPCLLKAGLEARKGRKLCQ